MENNGHPELQDAPGNHPRRAPCPWALLRCAVAACVLLAGAVFLGWNVQRRNQWFRQDFLNHAVSVAATLPGYAVTQLQGRHQDVEHPAYAPLEEQLRSLHHIHPDWEWLYLMRRDARGTIRFLMDSLPLEDPDSVYPGDPYGEAWDAIHQVFDSQEALVTGPNEDRWGTWITALIPVYSPGSPEPDAVLGIDIDHALWRSMLLRSSGVPAVFFLSLLMVVLLFFRAARRSPSQGARKNPTLRGIETLWPVLFGGLVTAIMVWGARTTEQRHQQENFLSLANERAEHVGDALREIDSMQLESLARFVESSEDVTALEFRRYTEPLTRNPGVVAWAWAAALPEEVWADLAPRAASEGWSEALTLGHSTIHPHDTQETHVFPLLYVEPTKAQEDFGYRPGWDLGASGPLRQALETALRSQRSTLTSPLRLAPLQPDLEHAFAVRGVWDKNRSGALRGFAVAVIDIPRLLRSVTKRYHQDEALLHLDLLGLAPSEEHQPTLLASTSLPSGKTPPETPAHTPSITHPVLAFGQAYGIAIRPTPAWRARHRDYISWIVLLSGVLLTAFSIGILVGLRRHHQRMDALVRERTRDLSRHIERYHLLSQQSRTITWETTRDGRYTYVSPVVRDVLGYEPHELEHQKAFYELNPAEGRDRFRTEIMALMALGAPFAGIANPKQPKRGEVVWLSTSGIPIRDAQDAIIGYHGTDIDITETRKAETALFESDLRFRMLTETMRDVVWVLDTDRLRFLYVSPSIRHLRGYSAEETMAQDFDETVLPQQREELRGQIHVRTQALLAGRITDQTFFTSDISHPCKDGSVVRTEAVTRYWLNARTGTVEMHGVSRDMTLRYREQMFRELSIRTLQILSQPDDLSELLHRIVDQIHQEADVQSVGIRLKALDNYPYAAQIGCECPHMKNGNGLVVRDAHGTPCRDESGALELRCICGLVLAGKTHPDLSLFTEGGSCWSNDGQEVLALMGDLTSSASCHQNMDGSLALIPIRTDDGIVGLLQLSDPRRGRFSRTIVEILEGVASHVGSALMRKRAERDYRMLFHEMLEGFAVHEILADAEGTPVDYRFLAINPAFEKLTGLQAQNVIGKTARELLPALESFWVETYGQVVLSGQPAFFTHYAASLDRHYEVTAFRSAPRQFACIFNDVTERIQADEALRESRRQYASLLAHLPGMAYRCINDRTWTMEFVSDGVRAITGYEPQDLVGNRRVSYNELIHPEDRERLWTRWQEAIRQNDFFVEEYRLRTRDGTFKWVWEQGEALYDEQDRVIALEGFVADISERKKAEEQREELQSQLIQSQKMESIGRLAGGVAHDFNNMLQAILGYTELAIEQVKQGEPLHADLLEIQNAAKRSSQLTGQLQAFARKQKVVPKKIHLNDAIEKMFGMLRRVIGEDVQLRWKPARKVDFVDMDPSQLDQIVTNLCVNARDAIQPDGHIILETANVRIDAPDRDIHHEIEPGEYVMLAVSDDGCGMTPEVIEHLFEPFFTTKGQGKGTGLGLATLYGIVRQNHGGIQVTSHPGQGSTFKIYLPRAEATGAVELPTADAQHVMPGHGETVLLVEDEELIIQTTRRMLESLGYKVMATCLPQEAETLYATHHADIDLLLTDVIMPGLNGPELVRRLRTRYPDLPCLFMSGYTANLLSQQGLKETDAHFIQKPFSRLALSHALRRILGNSES